ncbi:MAG: hypothetical protein K2K82_00680 [Muribaculaceae bacterium]|nr:hypothetical protein [Muribaculaceae bacterium]
MKYQIATNPSQSKRLLACGVDPNTADMYLSINMCPGENYGKYSTRVLGEDLITLSEILRSIDYEPAWSLSALLALLPTEIKEENSIYDEINTYGLLIYPYMQGWQVDYQYCQDDECHCLKYIHDFDLIGACVKAIEWLTANGYTLNTK